MAHWFRAPRVGRNLAERVVSAIVLGTGFVAAVFAGGPVFAAVVIAGAVLCLREWTRLTSTMVHSVDRWGPMALVPVPLLAGILWGPGIGLVLIAVVSASIYGLLRSRERTSAGYTAFGFLYVTVPTLSVLWLRAQPEEGLGLVLWFCAIIWINDIAAFASGRLIGGPKLAPSISPAKTWAGCAGGVLGAICVGALAVWLLDWGQPVVVITVSAVLAGVAQAGDLFESAIKRQFGVKDSGVLIPGHGGLLDRMDGFMAAAPVAALLLAIAGEPVGW